MTALNSGPISGQPQGSVDASTKQQPLQLKYVNEIRKIAGCPPISCEGSACQGYRFASGNLSSKDFLPAALISPQRILKGRPIVQCCTAYSLSLFQTLDQLRARAREGKKTAPNFLKRMGDHFVRLSISQSDGISTTPNDFGHFDFFECASFDALKNITEHGELTL